MFPLQLDLPMQYACFIELFYRNVCLSIGGTSIYSTIDLFEPIRSMKPDPKQTNIHKI
jgi:hypothetical protein